MAPIIYILLRNDDPGALSDPAKERRILELFARYNAPQVLAVIPNNIEDPHNSQGGRCHLLEENPAMVMLLKEYIDKGLVEIAQHGYTHQTNRFYPGKVEHPTQDHYYQGIDRKWAPYDPVHSQGYSEFNGLPETEQHDKVVQGQEYLEKLLGIELRSFIFPWNSYNAAALKILKKRGFQFVPGEEDACVMPGLYLIGACNWDWGIEKFSRLLEEMEYCNKPVLTQFAYHSWDISEVTLNKLERLLKEISQKNNMRFILPSQIPVEVPWVKDIIPLRWLVLKLEDGLNRYLKRSIRSPKFYVHDRLHYIKRILKLSAALAAMKCPVAKQAVIDYAK